MRTCHSFHSCRRRQRTISVSDTETIYGLGNKYQTFPNFHSTRRSRNKPFLYLQAVKQVIFFHKIDYRVCKFLITLLCPNHVYRRQTDRVRWQALKMLFMEITKNGKIFAILKIGSSESIFPSHTQGSMGGSYGEIDTNSIFWWASSCLSFKGWITANFEKQFEMQGAFPFWSEREKKSQL